MSALLKASSIRLTGERKATLPKSAGHDATRQASDDEDPNSVLKARIIALEQQLADLSQGVESRERLAYERGLDEGVEQGLVSAKRDHADKVQILRKAAEAASSSLDHSLAALEELAIEMAEASLSCVIDDPSRYAELIVLTVEKHLQGLTADAVLVVEVSSADFPSEDQLRDAFASTRQRIPFTLSAKPSAPAGTCLIELTLGKLDLGLSSQRQRLADAFSSLHAHA